MSDRLSDPELLHIITFSPIAMAIFTTTDMVVQVANNAMRSLWNKDEDIIGKPFKEIFTDKDNTTSISILKEVWNSGTILHSKNIVITFSKNGQQQTGHFDFEYRPIKDHREKVYCILQTATDVTDQVLQAHTLELLQKKQHDLNHALEASMEAYNRQELVNKNFLADSKHPPHTVLKGPVAIGILTGPDLIVTSANEEILQMWGRSADVIGKPILEALPELVWQPYPELFCKVFNTGEPYYGNSERAVLEMDGRIEERYFNFIYQPLKNAEGQVISIMVVANDVTEQVTFHTNIKQLNNKLTTTNEELCNANKQLTAANRELQQSQADLRMLYNQLEESEIRFKEIIKQAPVAIIIFQGKDMLIQTANVRMQELLHKDESIIGQPLLKAIPELADQQPYKLLHHVYITGRPIYKFDEPISLKRNNVMEIGYYNFSYTPLIEGGKITGVIDIAVEVTNQVKARQTVQQLNDVLTANNGKLHGINDELLMANDDLATAQKSLKKMIDQLRENESNFYLAIQSGNVGTWSVDMDTEKITMSDQSRLLFGFPLDVEITMQDVELAVEPGYFPVLRKALAHAIESGSDSDTAYPITHRLTNQRRWVRAIGKVYTNEKGKNYSGTLMDITEQKQDEQRHDHFINMVGHELKTPLTSTKAYVQLLQNKATKNKDLYSTELLAKVDMQVNRMTSLINGFLDISQLEFGKINIDKKTFDIADLIKEIQEESLSTNSTHHILFEPVEPVMVCCDRDKIGYVITNLISNAVKYSPGGSTVDIACVKEEKHVLVSVKDKGIGIEPGEVEKLFDRYYRGEGSGLKSTAGIGIGLYLCKEIITRHGGHIWVESVLHEGSTFYFTLPVLKE